MTAVAMFPCTHPSGMTAVLGMTAVAAPAAEGAIPLGALCWCRLCGAVRRGDAEWKLPIAAPRARLMAPVASKTT